MKQKNYLITNATPSFNRAATLALLFGLAGHAFADNSAPWCSTYVPDVEVRFFEQEGALPTGVAGLEEVTVTEYYIPKTERKTRNRTIFFLPSGQVGQATEIDDYGDITRTLRAPNGVLTLDANRTVVQESQDLVKNTRTDGAQAKITVSKIGSGWQREEVVTNGYHERVLRDAKCRFVGLEDVSKGHKSVIKITETGSGGWITEDNREWVTTYDERGRPVMSQTLSREPLRILKTFETDARGNITKIVTLSAEKIGAVWKTRWQQTTTRKLQYY